ncbi:MAG: 16S rRNA processing protein RimM [Halieaceae bacterium]|jgi:16S rRNA processing protein RimM
MQTPGVVGMLKVGEIAGAYGVKGWVKVFALTDPVENFFSYGSLFVRRRGEMEPIEFSEGRAHGKSLIARVAGINDRNAAEQARGLEIWVPESALPPLDGGEYYWRQLQGLQVWCEYNGEAQLLGQVHHLLETGANDVLVVQACDSSVDDRERLIPYLPGRVVENVDLAERRMTVRWHPDD